MASWIEELQFPHLHIPITIDHVSSVFPAGPIPAAAGDTLYLSNLDDVIGARVFTPTVYFYKSVESDKKLVGKVLLDALSKVLVPYYPFSGRLRETKNGKLEVFFGPNQGALMVEAHSDVSINDLGDLAVPNPGWTPLIYRFPNEKPYQVFDMPLVIAQVTSFSCGGFSLGLRLCHCLVDGLGAMQFVGAWAATARAGAAVTCPEPCWEREFFKPRVPPIVKFPHTEFMKIDDGSSLTSTLWQAKLVQKCFKMTQEFQNQLKQLAQPDDGQGCTSFDALAAHIWKSWVKALNVTPLDYELRLTFSVNARQKLLTPPLRDGYYGNVLCLACATSSVSQLVDGQLSAIARLVREARQNVTEEYVRSTVDYIDVDRPTRLEFAGKLTITQWTRFSIYERADFGWGLPVYAGPIDLTPTPQVCVILPDGEVAPGKSIVVCICLSEAAASKFRECLLEIP
ncbi:Acyl transferase [Thalictrum thalictroides]|uniref:Acyl transferase n=1 Tax=Thalictrum thalictroides TaxID=46969 RepID=A0A7J6X9G8_THATH|nr:Acyl transferase [Thalictrum thalictroides]